MKRNPSRFVCAWLAAQFASLLVVLNIGAVQAVQAAPAPLVKIVVPFTPAGVTDMVARVLAEKLAQRWQRPVIVENKPGAGGNIGAEFVSRAPADGSVFLLAGTSIVINAALQEHVPYQLMKTLEPVSLLAELPFLVVVSPTVPVDSIAGLIAHAKAHPGELNFGSGGLGTSPHMAGELFKQTTKTDIVHIPFRGAGPATAELVAGRIQVMIDSAQGLIPLVESGKLRALATPSDKRIGRLPSIPTMIEAGVHGFHVSSWLSLWAPGGTPRSVIDNMSQDIASVLQDSEVRKLLDQQVIEPVGSTPQEFHKFVETELAKWNQVIRQGAITVH
ncbi:tripartite tricarboxylate transporter substrate binding protein [Paracandidimonas lactea]|uniref:tripartite tricarboxylate transporter substrate binding protein n=1 Tax=Paracandidimonas lactea TaxID=2895524 RepID=UPI001F48B197|nr:tripartite tricarboxylate transporter substrate binding protein [Paracandidimonas lactea]